MDEPKQDRLPPYSPQMEKGVLGCILLDPKNSIPQCLEVINEGSGYFYDLRHEVIYQTMLELWDDRDPVELMSVIERLRAWDKLEQCGGNSYVSSLVDVVPSASNVMYYLSVVREKYLLRRMINAAITVSDRIYDIGDSKPEQALDEAEKEMFSVSQERIRTNTANIRTVTIEAMEDFNQAIRNGGALMGMDTGFPDLNRMTYGFQPGDMFVVAARPSLGKTSLAMNIAEYVSVEKRIPAGVFSLEMTAKQLVKRMICSMSRVSYNSAVNGYITDIDARAMAEASAAIQNSPLYIDDSGGLSILQVRSKARKWALQYGIKLLVIDYLQLLNASGMKRRYESRQQEVSDISHGIKELGKELSIPVLVLAQLNRDIERDKGRKPRLSDLRESGSIEQDADTVSFLYRPVSEENDPVPADIAEPINLYIAKQRNGPVGDIFFTFMKQYTRFELAAKVEPEPKEAPTKQQEFST